jgi:deoxyribodipyrimidine photo-lyase
MKSISIFWFRRDLRLHDNHALYQALTSGSHIIPVFIFDKEILEQLDTPYDLRVQFIHDSLYKLNKLLGDSGKRLNILHGRPVSILEEIVRKNNIEAVYANEDYEPVAIARDEQVNSMLAQHDASLLLFKDQVIYEKNEIVKSDGTPYTIYTPYSKQWLTRFASNPLEHFASEDHLDRLAPVNFTDNPTIEQLGFKTQPADFACNKIENQLIDEYQAKRDTPSIKATSRLGIHLRFGTISIRELVKQASHLEPTFLKELIWREFFMSILWHFPHTVESCFKKKYESIAWINDEPQFEKWCTGNTGYPIVDAGMRELNTTGFMHNRVRMIVASFLCKHLLIDWKWGERYFASRLLDYELSSNVGNWQWAAGCGCDAAPYFRIFNPWTQAKKFDPANVYIKKWVPELNTAEYPEPMIDHKLARERCLATYKNALSS